MITSRNSHKSSGLAHQKETVINFLRFLPKLLTILQVSFLMTGCSILEVKTAEPTPFLVNHEKLQALPDRSPFHLTWNISRERPEYKKKVFSQVYLKPVNLKYLDQSSVKQWQKKIQIREATEDETKEIAKYIYDKFFQALTNSAQHFKGAILPAADTLVVEIALVEFNPTQVSYKVTGAAFGAFVPGGSTVKTLGKGSIGIEVKFSDGGTGEILGEFADRREEKIALIADLNNLTRLGHAKEAIDDWAVELEELLSTPIDQKVERTPPFVIIGW